MTLPKLSIAAKLYAIFASDGHHDHRAVGGRRAGRAPSRSDLTDEFESANAGTWNVERVNGLIYAVVMESRGIYMSSDMPTSKSMPTASSNSTSKSPRWWRIGRNRCVRDDAELFAAFAKRIAKFIQFRDELARLGTEVSPAAGRRWGDNDANRAVRKALNADLEKLTGALRQARDPRLCTRSTPASTRPLCG